jgi:hypothetical protein
LSHDDEVILARQDVNKVILISLSNKSQIDWVNDDFLTWAIRALVTSVEDPIQTDGAIHTVDSVELFAEGFLSIVISLLLVLGWCSEQFQGISQDGETLGLLNAREAEFFTSKNSYVHPFVLRVT